MDGLTKDMLLAPDEYDDMPELERYALSIPLGVSSLLIFLNALQDLLAAAAGLPEPVPDHRGDPDT
jgi:hypothetical protein